MKIQISSISFTYSESDIINALTGKFFSVVAAEALVAAAAAENKTAAYFKTGFTITFEDGQTYSGRIDIYSAKTVPGHTLGDHVERHLRYTVNNGSLAQADEAQSFLDKYDIA